jgi:hypothetical protein
MALQQQTEVLFCWNKPTLLAGGLLAPSAQSLNPLQYISAQPWDPAVLQQQADQLVSFRAHRARSCRGSFQNAAAPAQVGDPAALQQQAEALKREISKLLEKQNMAKGGFTAEQQAVARCAVLRCAVLHLLCSAVGGDTPEVLEEHNMAKGGFTTVQQAVARCGVLRFAVLLQSIVCCCCWVHSRGAGAARHGQGRFLG